MNIVKILCSSFRLNSFWLCFLTVSFKVVRLLIVTLAASQLIKTHVAEAAKVRINPASKRSSLLRQASYSEQLKLQCKTRWFLQITEDGVVAGSANVSSPYGKELPQQISGGKGKRREVSL